MLGESSDALIFGNSDNVDARDMTRRLERLTPEQYHIADSIMTKLLEAFRLKG